MKVSFGLKAHSGWAALVVVGESVGRLVVVERARLELVEQAWQKAPYHAAEEMEPAAARDLVRRAVKSAHRLAVREVRAAVTRQRESGHDVIACAVLTSPPLPGWSVAEIVAVHFRMHQAEGFLFRDALSRAAEACGLRLLAIREKTLAADAAKALRAPAAHLVRRIASLRKEVGPPWGKDQKDAALAALAGLKGCSSGHNVTRRLR